MNLHPELKRWLTVALFAVAMAWVEAAVVFYLRTMLDRLEPYQRLPLPIIGGIGRAELIREASTLVMLLTVGMLAGRNWRRKFGYTVVAFGVWDIFYYVFLKMMTGWPNSMLDWDILFLLPLPWWGPVLAPVMIAGLMVVWGTLVTQMPESTPPTHPAWKAWAACFTGIALALYVFMADAIRVAGQGEEVLRELLPERFNWPLFCVAFVLMSVPVLTSCMSFVPRLLNAPSLAQTRNSANS